MPRTLRALIADDEPLIRLGIRRALEALPDVAVAAEAGSADEAVAAIGEGGVDLVVLDVQMPGGTGLDVVRRIGPSRMPPVIFVTAFDSYAVQAFEVNAADYVLKPFDPERLQQAVARARDRIEQQGTAALAARLQALLAAHEAPRYDQSYDQSYDRSYDQSYDQSYDRRNDRRNDRRSYPAVERLAVRTGERFDLVPVDAIDWIESADNYVKLHCGPTTHLLGETLTSLERRLDPSRFLRVHRSRMINRGRVVAVHVLLGGTYELELRDGTRLTSGRQYRDAVQKFLRPV